MLPAELAAIAGVVMVAGMLDKQAELTALMGMLAKLAKLAKNYKDVCCSNPDEFHCPAAITLALRYIFI